MVVLPLLDTAGRAFVDIASLTVMKVKIPRIDGEYVNIYKPVGDIFPGPSVRQLIADKHYDVWVPNDHCFVRDESGRWHLFGITHPRTDIHDVYLGEHQSFHANAPKGSLKNVLKEGTWKDLPKVLPPGERLGEKPENHAPYINKQRLLHYGLWSQPD
jgi:beta-fructofuranosidase